MRDLPRDAHFVVKARQHPGVPRHGFGQKLERHWLIEREIVGAIDLTHTALAEQADDLVARGHQHARGKTSIA